MHIDFEQLREKGWKVDVAEGGVLIYGTERMAFLGTLEREIRAAKLNLTNMQVDVLLDEFAGKLETQLIFNDLT